MRFEIVHISEYLYSAEVFFEPHYFRFKPKSTPHLEVKDFSIEIEPKPTGRSEQIDIENNHILLSWFDDMHQELSIKARSLIEVSEFNPFNFLVHPDRYLHVPFEYENKTESLLKPSLKADPLPQSMMKFTNGILETTKGNTIDLILELTVKLHQEFELSTREVGKPLSPEITFRQKEGSCRDLAWMQIHMLRQLGIAARFVSGYYYLDTEEPEFELHAWVEAYLPGAGWIGMDPGHGILTSFHHIPVASSAYYENTMPVTGSIRGNAESNLKNELKISLMP